MEINSENSNEPDKEKIEVNANEIDVNLPDKIVLIRTEDSIIQEASEHIDHLTKTNLSSVIEVSNKNKRLDDGESNGAADKSKTQKADLEKQVQIGEITPFEAVAKQSKSQKVKGTFNKTSHLLDLEKYLQQQAELAKQRKQLKKPFKSLSKEDHSTPAKKAKLMTSISKTSKKHKSKSKAEGNHTKDFIENAVYSSIAEIVKLDEGNSSNGSKRSKNVLVNLDASKDNTGDSLMNISDIADTANESGSEYVPSDEQIDSDTEERISAAKKKNTLKSKGIRTRRILDDGDEEIYKHRVETTSYSKNESFHKVDNLFKVPQCIWKRLYRYQKVSVQWLWELHGRGLGGLLGDEMGLGKTVQVIAFLAGLDCSELLSDGGRFRGLGPTLIVCPATLLEQWVKHFHDWRPTLRIAILHQSGTHDGDAESLIHSLKAGGILVTSYSGVLRHKDLLVSTQWHYVILDEGHKIRNPQAKVSKAVKEFSTPHRLLLTGSPMQNSLKELWSLFDFILPGKLGTLPAFLEHCASPITRGGYANATPLQEATALQVATMLKDAITPYMLRRTKTDVKHHVSLPEKNEQVLFCSLTDEQKRLYKEYLRSEEVAFVLHEKNNVREYGRYKARLLIALSALRKICNHPDLFLYTSHIDSDEDIDIEEDLDKFGYWKRAGKMTVVRSLLKIWKKQGHRVLLFTQGRQMMHILESLLQQEEYTYLRMDGTTPMSQRQQTIRTFNSDPSYFVFLLTTRVGGLGVNLTGANRVVIYDPDWNPATDAQARERAWRIGQNKRVTIYRLITAGTIEEKIYHRQIFKVLLSNKVLEDPRQRKIFKTSELAELFNLNEPIDGEASESDRLFKDSRLIPITTKFSSSKIEEMRRLASTLSKSISQKVQSADNTKESRTENNTNADDAEKHSNDRKKQAGTEISKNDHTEVLENKEVVDAVESVSVQKIAPETTSAEKCSAEEQTVDTNTGIFSAVNENNENIDEFDNQISPNTENNTMDVNMENAKVNAETAKSTHAQVVPEQHNSANINMCTTVINSEGKNCETVTSDKDKDEVTEASKTHRKRKHRKKSSHGAKNNVSAMFEGERISCLIGRRLGRSEVKEPSSTADDEYVLNKLFAKSTVSSAFQHDSVLSNAIQNTTDGTPMQRLARETAQESMEFVRKSRKWCWKPTWDKVSPGDE